MPSCRTQLEDEVTIYERQGFEDARQILHGIKAHRTYQRTSVNVQTGPETALTTIFRARVFQSDEALFRVHQRSESSIGPPPPQVTAAGSINARGIPVSYGATDRSVTPAEVRPPGGSKVVVAQFDLIRPLQLLSVEALRYLPVDDSAFDPQYLPRKQKAAFLNGLSEEIAKPVMPDDEALNYIRTQVIADISLRLTSPIWTA